jgi:hypothetical protein
MNMRYRTSSNLELWQIASSVAQSEQERVVLIESFVYARPPCAIAAGWPYLFAGVAEVYTIKRDLLDRIKRCPQMQRLCRDSQLVT